jgi:hypothetical protein
MLGSAQDEDSKWSLRKVDETKRGIFTLIFEGLAILGMLPFLVSPSPCILTLHSESQGVLACSVLVAKIPSCYPLKLKVMQQ